MSIGRPRGEVRLLPLDDLAGAKPRPILRRPEVLWRASFHPDGRQLATGGRSGQVQIWDLANADRPTRLLHQPPGGVTHLAFGPEGKRLAAASYSDHVAVWDLEGPPDAEPILLPTHPNVKIAAFHPNGSWLATTSVGAVKAWPITRRYVTTLVGHEEGVTDLEFLPDGRSIVAVSGDGTMRLWPLSADAGAGHRILLDLGGDRLFLHEVDAAGTQLLGSSDQGTVFQVPLDGAPPREVALSEASGVRLSDVNGDRAAAIVPRQDEKLLRLWDLATGQPVDYEIDPEIWGVGFTDDGELLSLSPSSVGRWSSEAGAFEELLSLEEPFDPFGSAVVSDDGRHLLLGNQGDRGEAVLYDLEAGTSVQLDSHGPGRCAVFRGELVVTRPCGDKAGDMLVGSVGSGPVHLLPNTERLSGLTISPDGRWIAARTEVGGEIRLWPIPELSQPALHTLPLDRLLAKLRTQTNVRVVADPESETGWKLDHDPFPGWETTPDG